MKNTEKQRSYALKCYHNRLNRMSPKELEAERVKQRARQVAIRVERKIRAHTRAALDQMAAMRLELGINPIKPRAPGNYMCEDRAESDGAYFWDLL
jgi:hypothetical protein